MKEIKHYVVTYTENNQHHEVIWHALSVEDALQSIKASYIDPKDFDGVSNLKFYEVVDTGVLAALQSTNEGQAETIRLLRETNRDANALLTRAEGYIGYLADAIDADEEELNLHLDIKEYLDRKTASTTPKDGQG